MASFRIHVLIVVGACSAAACDGATAPEPPEEWSLDGALAAANDVLGETIEIARADLLEAMRDLARPMVQAGTLGAVDFGTTFQLSTLEEVYEPAPNREGAPADGLRFILYEVSDTVPLGAVRPLVEIGYVDIIGPLDSDNAAIDVVASGPDGAMIEFTGGGVTTADSMAQRAVLTAPRIVTAGGAASLPFLDLDFQYLDTIGAAPDYSSVADRRHVTITSPFGSLYQWAYSIATSGPDAEYDFTTRIALPPLAVGADSLILESVGDGIRAFRRIHQISRDGELLMDDSKWSHTEQVDSVLLATFRDLTVELSWIVVVPGYLSRPTAIEGLVAPLLYVLMRRSTPP